MDNSFRCIHGSILIIQASRLVDDSKGESPYKPVSKLSWTEGEIREGKVIKIHKFPKNHRVKLFQVPVFSDRVDFVATNDLFQHSAEAAQKESGSRWKVDEFHREIKQTTGIEHCKCRCERIQRNHIGCAMLVWTRLKELAYKTGKTVYDLKHDLLDDYLIQQLKNPSIRFA